MRPGIGKAKRRRVFGKTKEKSYEYWFHYLREILGVIDSLIEIRKNWKSATDPNEKIDQISKTLRNLGEQLESPNTFYGAYYGNEEFMSFSDYARSGSVYAERRDYESLDTCLDTLQERMRKFLAEEQGQYPSLLPAEKVVTIEDDDLNF